MSVLLTKFIRIFDTFIALNLSLNSRVLEMRVLVLLGIVMPSFCHNIAASGLLSTVHDSIVLPSEFKVTRPTCGEVNVGGSAKQKAS